MTLRRRSVAAATLLVLGGTVACTADAPSESMPGGEPMQLTSSAFNEDGAIPPEHTCDGADTSPPLAWSDVPDGTAAFVLLVEDPDAGGFVHWLLTDIPGDARELPAGEGDAIGMPGRNDFGRTGWGGPCPPSGEHRYVFTLYALSEPIQPDADAGADAVREAIAPRVVGQGSLNGVYARQG